MFVINGMLREEQENQMNLDKRVEKSCLKLNQMLYLLRIMFLSSVLPIFSLFGLSHLAMVEFTL